MSNRIIYLVLSLLLFILCSCTGTRYSSESILKEVDLENIYRVEISDYFTALNMDSDTSYNKHVANYIIESPLIIELKNDDTRSLKVKLTNLLSTIPNSRPEPYSNNELIKFKKEYMRKNKIDTFDIDSLYSMSRKKKGTRNILSYRYSFRLYFHVEDETWLSFTKSNDNIIQYGFCCTDFENNWFYRNLKGYTAYSIDYILDIEFQKRYIEMFNSFLSYYNKTNGTDYPLLDVDYEIWSGIIRDY